MIERSRANAAAEATLAWLATRTRWRPEGATPIDILAQSLGLATAPFDAALHPGVWGYLEPGEDLIFLRAGLTEAARRFTLAHEIGHAALHRGYGQAASIAGMADSGMGDANDALAVCRGADVETFDLVTDETLSPGQSYRPHAEIEQEANAFAVALLMPAEPFLRAYLTLCARPAAQGAFAKTTRALAKRFAISEDAALRRLQSLLVPERDGAGAAATMRSAGDEQQRAAARLEPPALVMAGPGSGKTMTLVARAVHLVTERGVPPDGILAVTFSRKAAGELRERIRAALPEAGRGPQPLVSTIHGFCLDLLGRYGGLVGLAPDFRLASDIEAYFLIREIMRVEPLRRLSPAYSPDQYVRDAQQAISRAKDDLLEASDLQLAAERADALAENGPQRDAAEAAADLVAIFERYQSTLAERHMIDYGDVIALVARMLAEAPDVAREVAERRPHLLVDEYQDINRAMGDVIERLVAAGCGLWAVGDADQSIYRFRGADPGIVSRFGETYSGARVASLVRNYRSHQAILDAATAFAGAFSQVDDRLALEAARVRSSHDAAPASVVHWAVAETSDDELAGLAGAMWERRGRGVPFGDQVALVRTRRQVDAVSDGLRARGIPVSKFASALEQEQVKRLLAVVSLLSEPAGAGLIRAGRAREHSFSRADAVATLSEARRARRPLRDALDRAGSLVSVSVEGRRGLRKLGRVLAALQANPSVSTGLCQYVFSFSGLGARILSAPEAHAEEALAIRRMLDIARAYDMQRATIAENARVEGADWFGFAEFLAATRILRLDGVDEGDAPTPDVARVLTVHGSKGLEFPVVYLPQLVNRRFPLTARPGSVVRAGQSSRADDGGQGDLSEEAALFYVAMTRARDELILSHARRYGRASYMPSPFLGPIEQALGDALIIEQWRQPAGHLATEETVTPTVPVAMAHELRTTSEFELIELETYQRCPRQYAYRFVDALWTPTPLGSLFTRTTARVARELEQALAESGERGSAPPSRHEARALMEDRWRDAVSDERRTAQATEAINLLSLEAYYGRRAQLVVDEIYGWLLDRGATAGSLDGSSSATRAVPVTVSLGDIAIRGMVDVAPVPAQRAGRAAGDGRAQAAPVRVIARRTDSAASLRDLFVELANQQTPGSEGRQEPFVRDAAAKTLSPRIRARLTQEALDASAGILRGEFHPQPDEWKCQRCPFAAACPE